MVITDPARLLAPPPPMLALPARVPSRLPLDSVVVSDALEFLRGLPDASVDVCFADPPYNNGTAYDGYNDCRSDYAEWCKAWFAECLRVANRVIVTPGHGNLWMWGAIEKPFGVGCWYKPGNPASSVLGWETWEPWLYYCRDRKILGGPSDIYATVSKQRNTGNHPCPKPLEFLRGLLRKVGKPGDVVLDPFCGSGTTLLAAYQLGMHYIGCDQSQVYVNDARARLAQPYTLSLFDKPAPAIQETLL